MVNVSYYRKISYLIIIKQSPLSVFFAGITSIFAVSKGLKSYLPRLIEGEILNLDSILETCSLIETMTITDKKTHPCIGKNYFLLDNGILILKKILEYIPANKMLATHYGLRQGLINEYFK